MESWLRMALGDFEAGGVMVLIPMEESELIAEIGLLLGRIG